MSKKTALLNRRNVERAIDRLITEVRILGWHSPEGQYRRILLDMALTYLGGMDLWTKPKKPKAQRVLKDAGNEVLKAVGKAWSPGSKRKPKPKRRTAR